MKTFRTRQFAIAGAFVSLLLAAVGYRMDAAVPAIQLDQQVLYNWLTLIFSPASFLLRLNSPDGPIVPGLLFVTAAVALNALWYALVRSVYVALARPAEMPEPSLAAAGGSGVTLSTRRDSPVQRLADRYEQRLSTEHDPQSMERESELVASEAVRH